MQPRSLDVLSGIARLAQQHGDVAECDRVAALFKLIEQRYQRRLCTSLAIRPTRGEFDDRQADDLRMQHVDSCARGTQLQPVEERAQLGELYV